ncbi:unnamed protein product [Calypogeia fissa]
MEPAADSLTYETFLECCGSTAFAAHMAQSSPFSSIDHVIDTARRIWWNEVSVLGWLEAFAAHPRIGDVQSLEKKFSTGKQLAAGEQSAALNTAANNELQELADWNHKYEERFGHVFLICASGKSCSEVLTALKARFSNRPGDEIRVAAAEQQKITELRLRNLKAWENQSSRTPFPGKAVKELQNAHIAGATRPPITTHVLDVSLGAPGVGIDVLLEKCNDVSDLNSFTGDGSWTTMGSSVTNSDGRSGPLMGNSNFLQAGRYRLTFKTGEYFLRSSKTKDGISGFYPYIILVFEVKPSQVAEHFHVPLLISPYSYTTYRGS